MAQARDESRGAGELLQLTVDVWHPDCWTLQTTSDRDAGLLGYGTTGFPGASERVGYYTAFGESRDSVDGLVDAVRAADRVTDVVDHAPGPDVAPVARNVVVTTGSSGGMRGAFRSRGYLHVGPTCHRDGREQRILLTRTERPELRKDLAAIESAFDADVDLTHVTAVGSGGAVETNAPPNRLSVRQREAFVLARERGYYEYPREVSTATLADELDISETTFLEHLRKAERTLLSDCPVHR